MHKIDDQAELLVRASYCSIYKAKDRLYVFELPYTWTAVAQFVTALITVMFSIVGILIMVGIEDDGLVAGLVMLGVSMTTGYLFFRFRSKMKEAYAMKPSELKSRFIIDLGAGKLLDGEENPICDLASVSLENKMQLTSSSPSLIVVHPSGSIDVVAGNPFAGGAKPIERTLRQVIK